MYFCICKIKTFPGLQVVTENYFMHTWQSSGYNDLILLEELWYQRQSQCIKSELQLREESLYGQILARKPRTRMSPVTPEFARSIELQQINGVGSMSVLVAASAL